MSNFKEYFTYDCISFTFVMLIYSVLAWINFYSEPTVITIFELFAMTSCAEILMFITDCFSIKKRRYVILMNLIDILVSVFILGIAFHMFGLGWISVLSVTMIILVTYFGVFGVSMIKSQADACSINRKIEQFKNKTKEEEKTHE